MTRTRPTFGLPLVLTLLAAAVACGSAEADGAPDTKNEAAPNEPPGGATAGGASSPSTTGPTTGGTPAPADAGACSGRAAQPRDGTWTISFGGRERKALVHVPPAYDPSARTPLVLDIHGYTSNATEQEALSGMNAKADAKGFLAIYPEGLDSSWNAGACCGRSAADAIDDVGFLTALLDRAEAELCVDARRVFATGMSNGGFLSHRLGCELAGRIAAVAPVAGVNGMPSCKPVRPMPVFHTHGTADTLVPYLGSPALGFIPVRRSFEEWAARNGCTGDPVETYQNGEASCLTYATCAGGAEVTLCTVLGGGHTWPGGMPVPALGFTSRAMSATDMMWDFFERHPLP